MTEDDFEEFNDGQTVALTPKGLHMLCRIMAFYKQGVDLEDIAELLNLGGKEHIQLLMHVADRCGVTDIVDDFAHPVWALEAKSLADLFDAYADALDDDRRHREFHAAGSAFGFFQTVQGVLPDDFTRVWIEELFNEVSNGY